MTDTYFYNLMLTQLKLATGAKLENVDPDSFDVTDAQLNHIISLYAPGCSVMAFEGSAEAIHELLCKLSFHASAAVTACLLCRLLKTPYVFFLTEPGAGILLTREEIESRVALFTALPGEQRAKAVLLSCAVDLDMPPVDAPEQELSVLRALMMFNMDAAVVYSQALSRYYNTLKPITILVTHLPKGIFSKIEPYSLEDCADVVSAGKFGAESVIDFWEANKPVYGEEELDV